MIRSVRFYLSVLILPGCASVWGDSLQLPQDLYLDAMRAIAEGRQSDASNALTHLIEREPHHAGAWLDLAIIQCQLGHANEAERLFHAIESRFSPPPGILEVISKHRTQGCAGSRPHSRLSIGAGRGVNSNVNQGTSNSYFSVGSGDYRVDLQLLPEYLPQRDNFTTLSTEYMRELAPDGSLGFVQFQTYQNDTLSHFNTSSLIVGLEHPWRFDNWHIRGTGILAVLGLGGQLYQKQTQIQARISPPLPLPDRLQFSMVTSLTQVEYPTQNKFDAYTWETRGVLTYRTEQSLAQAALANLTDKATADRPGGDRQGWSVNLQGHTRLAENVFGELGWSRQTWLSQSAYSPGLIDQIRHQKTQVLKGTLIFPVTNQQAIHLDWREVQNVENITLFQYNSYLLQASWQWQGTW